MRIYFGSHMQVLALGVAIGALLGWALTRWYYRWRHVRELRGIQRRIAGTITETPWGYVDGYSPDGVKTELRRRKL